MFNQFLSSSAPGVAPSASGLLHGPSPAGLLPEWLDPTVFLENPAIAPWAVFLVCAIVFAESGLLLGFFLPGDSLLFTAGLLVATGTISVNLWFFVSVIFVSAFVGDQVGYYVGKRTGLALFRRPDSRFFKQEYAQRAHDFFEKHGGKAVVLARFVPIIRTFTPVIAGVAHMNYRSFVLFNALGALGWGIGITLLGYLLGDRVPFIRKNIDLILIAIVALSLVPIAIEILRGLANARNNRRKKESESQQTGAA